MKASHVFFASLFSLFLLAFALPAFALDLQHARTQGMVGEQRNGYIAAIAPNPEVNALVADVNSRRKQEYERISKENGQTVDVVAKLAAVQIIGKLAPGSVYEGEQGGWQKK